MERHAKELDLNQLTCSGKPLKDFKQERNMIRFLASSGGGQLEDHCQNPCDTGGLNKAAERQYTGYETYS